MASDPQTDGTRWVACTGCNGELGIPSSWSEPVAKCPNCGRDVAIETVPQVLWRPKASLTNSAREENAVAAQPLDSTGNVPPTRTQPATAAHRAEAPFPKDYRVGLVQTAPHRVEEPAGTSSPADAAGNPAAITGLCLGIASVLLGAVIGILPILAVVFSGIGLAKAQSRNGKGQVAAWIGLVLGIVFTLVYLNMYGHI